MATERIKCAECDSMILPATAEANAGLCAQCVKISPEQREASRGFEAALVSGELWTPSQSELSTALTPRSLSEATWQLEPDYYADHPDLTVSEALRRASAGEANEMFLYADGGSRLLVSLNSKYGVCEYQNKEENDWRYAYSQENLVSQVPEGLHLSQPCACCGVGLGWYPSRAHMPRKTALKLLTAIASPSPDQRPPTTQWLELGDISHYYKGRG